MMIPFGDTNYFIDINETGLYVTAYSSLYYVFIIFATIIWAALFTILIILLAKTKLTYVDLFRKNFLIGVVLLLFVSAIWYITTSLFLDILAEIQLYTNLAMSIVYIISSYFLVRGLLNLNDYLDSLIGTKEQKYNLKVFVIVVILTVIYAVYDLIVHYYSPFGFYGEILIVSIFISQMYISIYSFYLHRIMKDLKINMMLYFGIGFILLVLTLAIGSIIELETAIYIISLDLAISAFLLFLILGYLDFKNRISKYRIEIRES